MSERFTLGVNYWPRRKAMYWWSNFDSAEVLETSQRCCPAAAFRAVVGVKENP